MAKLTKFDYDCEAVRAALVRGDYYYPDKYIKEKDLFKNLSGLESGAESCLAALEDRGFIARKSNGMIALKSGIHDPRYKQFYPLGHKSHGQKDSED